MTRSFDPARILVLCPHFEPDTAPTGIVISRIVHEMTQLGHEVHVVTSLPWYRDHRVSDEWKGVTWRSRTTSTQWGSVTRLDPYAGSDRRNLLRRAIGFLGFSVTSAVASLIVARRHDVDVVLVMSPPLTLGLSAKFVSLVCRVPMILNVQDVFPDAAIETGAITNSLVIRAAKILERFTYRAASVITVLSEDLRVNVEAKLPRRLASRVQVIPNFVDVTAVVPCDRNTPYRRELGLSDQFVVMYAGNVGYSQSLDLLLGAARVCPDIAFVINGNGSARADLQARAQTTTNVIFGDFQPAERLSEVLGTADLHVVLLREGLGRVSVPSKTYSILAAGRPVLAAIDPGTEVPRLIESSGAGVVVPPDDLDAFVNALRGLVGDPVALRTMGLEARRFIESAASPALVAERYGDLICDLIR